MMPRCRCNWDVVRELTSRERLTIRDVGHRIGRATVTNDVENVVRFLWHCGLLPFARRLFYFDSDGRLDEIVHDGRGEFVEFRPGTARLAGLAGLAGPGGESGWEN